MSTFAESEDENEKNNNKDEVQETVNEMTTGNTLGLDGFFFTGVFEERWSDRVRLVRHNV